LGGVVAGIAKQVFEPVGWVRDAAILGYRAGEAWVTGSTALDLSNFQPSSDLTRSLIERERSGEEVGSAQAASEFVVAGITAPIQVPYEFGRALAGGDLAEIGEQSVNMLLLLASMRGGEGRGLRAGPEAPVQRVPSGQGVAPDAPTYRLFREKVTTGGEVESLAAGSEAQRHGTPMSQPAEVSAPSQQEQASMPHMTYGERDLGPAGPDLQLGGRVPTPLQQKRMGGRGTFGDPSTERAGTHHRKGMNYGELNAAEIDRGLKVDWDPAAGRPRSVTFRIDPEVARLSYEDPKRRFIPDRSTEGLQPSDDAYRKSGYDRFHLAQREAFKGSVETERSADLMTAVVPATERLNRGPGSPWRAAEAADVKLAARTGSPLTVVVEPIYDLNPLRLRDGTPVPARIRRVTTDAAGRTIRDQTFENR
jgi:hypothetical protein